MKFFLLLLFCFFLSIKNEGQRLTSKEKYTNPVFVNQLREDFNKVFGGNFEIVKDDIKFAMTGGGIYEEKFWVLLLKPKNIGKFVIQYYPEYYFDDANVSDNEKKSRSEEVYIKIIEKSIPIVFYDFSDHISQGYKRNGINISDYILLSINLEKGGVKKIIFSDSSLISKDPVENAYLDIDVIDVPLQNLHKDSSLSQMSYYYTCQENDRPYRVLKLKSLKERRSRIHQVLSFVPEKPGKFNLQIAPKGDLEEDSSIKFKYVPASCVFTHAMPTFYSIIIAEPERSIVSMPHRYERSGRYINNTTTIMLHTNSMLHSFIEKVDIDDPYLYLQKDMPVLKKHVPNIEEEINKEFQSIKSSCMNALLNNEKYKPQINVSPLKSIYAYNVDDWIFEAAEFVQHLKD